MLPNHTLSIQRAKPILAEVMVLVKKLHAKPPGIFHEDLHPKNIMVDETGHLVVIDFGNSKIDDPKDSRTMKDFYDWQFIFRYFYDMMVLENEKSPIEFMRFINDDKFDGMLIT